MSEYIVNAAPLVVDRGTQDLSLRALPREPEAVPQHCPKFFIFAQKGPLEPQLLSGSERINMFGEATFDLRSKYANHQTVFANLANAEGNLAMYQRLVPEDAGPLANITLWLDVLPTIVDIYERNNDGSIKTNNLGQPIITGTAPGYKVKWTKSYRSTQGQVDNFGTATIQPGTQTDPDTSVQSQAYPIYEFLSSNVGEYSNNCGFRMWPLDRRVQAGYPSKMMMEARAFPFYFQAIRRSDKTSSPKIVTTVLNDQSVLFTTKENVIEPSTDSQVYMGDVVINSYSNTEDPRYPPVYGDIEKLAIYQNNINTLLELFHASEIDHIDMFSDFTDDPDDMYLVNHLTFCTSEGVPYHSIQIVDDPSSLRWSPYNNFYMEGGSDGTMTDEIFAELVEEYMERYLDRNDELQDLAYHVESVIYDSGFPLSTKYALCKFIGVRHDTFVVLSTHEAGEVISNEAEEQSIAVALRTRLQNFPESDYFGTGVMRGLIMGRSGKLRNSQYKNYLPLTAELNIKSARYMGAANGKWKNGLSFDNAANGGSIIDNMTDISIKWIPASVRNRAWDMGLNFVIRHDRRSFQFPALKTVYSGGDSSVLNSYFTAMAICYLNKIVHAAWRQFTGTSGLTDAQLEERVNAYVSDRIKDAFDGRYVVVPDAFHTEYDTLAGYRWSLVVRIYSPNMKTVQVTNITAHRIGDLGA